MIRLPRLYAVADGSFGNPVDLAGMLFRGGAELVQIRHKSASSKTLIESVEAVMEIAPAGFSVVVNDRADVARLTNASGVHLGQQDLKPVLARRVLSAGQWIGCSTHNVDQAIQADQEPVDYIAVGPIFTTSTKEAADPTVGLSALREICSRVKKPVVAIGGITLDTARDVLQCGAASVAVIRDVLGHGDIEARTRLWVRHLES
jgi:thiamine-phosphate pyrophosphorylase